jgi:hypothetical protein
MGLYWDLFYGAVNKDINDEQRDELASICKNNWWTLHQEKSVYMINAHFPKCIRTQIVNFDLSYL